MLLDIGDTASAVELTGYACGSAGKESPALLMAWLLAGHGEALAANGDRDASAQAFDRALGLMAKCPAGEDVPYLVFDQNHLTRWRGSALA
ncbi:hypothetical protein J7S33_09925, partial [Saccharothrix algeriensis]